MSISAKGKRSPTASPCIGTCSTVLGDEVCRGCGRTFDEVLNWHNFTDNEKKAVNFRLKMEGKLKF